MTIDTPYGDEERTVDEVLAEVADLGISGQVIAENRVDEIHNGLGEYVTEENPFDIDGYTIASDVAEQAEESVYRAAMCRVSDPVAEEAGVQASEEAREEFLRLVREESPRLNDTSE